MATDLTDDRATALKIGYAATDWTQPIDYDVYEAAMREWDVKLIVRDGEPIGAAYFRDGEVHASILPAWRRKWATRGILAQLFAADNAFTRVTPGHEHMYAILARLGFAQCDDGTVARIH